MHIFLSSPAVAERIRVELYENDAPQTCKAVLNALPVEGTFKQAAPSQATERTASLSICLHCEAPQGAKQWCDDALTLSIPQENATIHPKPGEISYAPPSKRSEVAKSIAIIYGDATLVDAVNIFGRVADENLPKLKMLGEKAWLEGQQTVRLEQLDI